MNTPTRSYTQAELTGMPADVTIACVGKPSAGKSSFLNAVTDAAAKVGAALSIAGPSLRQRQRARSGLTRRGRRAWAASR